MICENCNERHIGAYGSGRFCSEKCARAFSTKAKRKEINKKVSLTMTKPPQIFTCMICGKIFKRKGRPRKTCSKECLLVVYSRAGKHPKPGNGGLRPGGGRTKVLEYTSKYAGTVKLNKDEIEVAKALDTLGLPWKRNTWGWPYQTLDGKNRKYYPDFLIPELQIFIEYKGWIDKKNSHKMTDAVQKNNFVLVIIHSNAERYRNLGLNLSEVQENPELILKEAANVMEKQGPLV